MFIESQVTTYPPMERQRGWATPRADKWDFGFELCCKSYYSFLQGASSPAALIERAVELGMPALGLADVNGLYGASTFYKLCKEAGIHPILGAEFDGAILLCENMEGYRTLSQVITRQEWLEPTGLIALIQSEEAFSRHQKRFDTDHLYVALTNYLEEGDTERCRRLKRLGVPSVETNRPHYAREEEGELLDLLTCIKHGKKIDDSHAVRPGNHERYLKKLSCHVSKEIAERCQVDLDFSSYRFPNFPVPSGETTHTFLRKLCERKGTCSELDEELQLIEKLDLSAYFLVVWDICEFAKSKGIPVQGRGSAANSLVAYLLGITPVDPLKHKLFLGRFIHEEMTTIPDIDLDFAASRDSGLPDREDVIQYVYKKYGEEYVAMVCTFITFQKRLARREVGKVLGEDHPRFEELVERMLNIPRHVSIHVGGMLISSKPISQLVPLQPARMEGRIVCQWDKDMVEDAGLIKVDILGLGMLAVLRDVGIDEIPEDDPAVYEMIGRADTVGLFQIESRAQMQSLPRTKPQNLPELGVQVALIRPGPLQGNMVSPYIKRKQGKEAVSYLHPSLEAVLEETLGVILFQEQVLQVATLIAGFSPGEAEGLRRAMSRKRSQQAMEKIKHSFLERAIIPAATAEKAFELLRGFASYGFCKSHALSFATIAYRSAYLKLYHPAEYTAALLNNQPMGFYSPETLIEDAKRRGVQILPQDINCSRARSTIEKGAIRLGLNLITGHGPAIEAGQPYRSVEELAEVLGTRTIEKLILSGALDSLNATRREELWKLWGRCKKSPTLPTQSEWEKLLCEYETIDLSKHHPLAFLRESLSSQGYQDSRSLKKHATVAGLMICRQRPPTAKGFAFLTLEDEFGLMNVVIPPKLYEQNEALIRSGGILALSATKQTQDGVINLKATTIHKLEVLTTT